jgi:hypothetical protein
MWIRRVRIKARVLDVVENLVKPLTDVTRPSTTSSSLQRRVTVLSIFVFQKFEIVLAFDLIGKAGASVCVAALSIVVRITAIS